MRHGHKSSRRRFDGHKAAIVVDTDSQLITAVDVLQGNAPDYLGALELVRGHYVWIGQTCRFLLVNDLYSRTLRRRGLTTSVATALLGCPEVA